jgi:glutamyl-tRNA synthetase
VPELLMGHKLPKVKNDTIGDFVITRPGLYEEPGMPLYNFVCTVDDALMGITHVIRGVEHLSNAVKQILLSRALGYKIPQFVHLPLILKDGKKMSKRNVQASELPVGIMDRAKLGYLQEACFNYLALLGWSPTTTKEFYTKEELINEFSLERLSRSNANFDEKKFLFINSHYIKLKTNEELLELITPYLVASGLDLDLYTTEKLQQMVNLEKERCKTLSEFSKAVEFFFKDPDGYEGVEKTSLVNAKPILLATHAAIQQATTFSMQEIEDILNNTCRNLQLTFKDYGPIVRLALTGKARSPRLAELIFILGKDRACQRLLNAQEGFKQYICYGNRI